MTRQATLPLLFVLSPSLSSDGDGMLERRVRRSLLRREPLLAGTAAAPYEPASSGSPLRALLREEGLEIVVTTASPRLLRELDLLIELDRRHAVTVRMVVPAWSARDPERVLRAVRSLAAEGISTRVVLRTTASSSGGEEGLRFLLEGARDSGALDVEIDAGSLRRAERARLLAVFRRLRLECGFPQRAAGRG